MHTICQYKFWTQNQLFSFLLLTKVLVLFLFGGLFFSCSNSETKIIKHEDERFNTHVVDLKKQDLKFYSKDEKGDFFENFNNLKNELKNKNKDLVFAMNGGMFHKNLAAVGLYIENGTTHHKLNKSKKGNGNFYLMPNGVFYITIDNEPVICPTDSMELNRNIKYATQSGPLLLNKGRIHPKFNKGSKNVHIRNGVGILEDGSLLFAISKEKVNFFEFADFFKKNGCQNALYLDGYISKAYFSDASEEELGGLFSIIIAEVK